MRMEYIEICMRILRRIIAMAKSRVQVQVALLAVSNNNKKLFQ